MSVTKIFNDYDFAILNYVLQDWSKKIKKFKTKE